MQNLLISIKHIYNKSSTENKYKIAYKCSEADTCDVGIIMIAFMFENIFS